MNIPKIIGPNDSADSVAVNRNSKGVEWKVFRRTIRIQVMAM